MKTKAISPAGPRMPRSDNPPPLYVVSGGIGASGEQLVNTVLAQFPGAKVPIVTIRNVRRLDEIASALAQVKAQGGTIVHTLVDGDLREKLISLATAQNVPAIDLMGPLLSRLTSVLGQQPAAQPGLYRQLHHSYYERVAAIEYTIAHDDGQKPEGWPEADLLLLGVSRTGKTPLSVYLSVLGWKVANLPIVPGLEVPPQLFQLEAERVIGLTIDVERLMVSRRQRAGQLGAPGRSDYADPLKIEDELQIARKLFRQGGFHIMDVTDKTVEAIADEIIRRVERSRGSSAGPGS